MRKSSYGAIFCLLLSLGSSCSFYGVEGNKGSETNIQKDSLSLVGKVCFKSPLHRQETVFWVDNKNALLRDGQIVADSDGDGLSDIEEFQLGTDVHRIDTDGDQLNDLLEVLMKNSGFDPLVRDSRMCNLESPYSDRDGDGLNDCEEILLGTNPSLMDSDGDGLLDISEMKAGSNPTLDDYTNDPDHDGVTNGEEIRRHLNPGIDESSMQNFAYQYLLVQREPRAVPEISQPSVITGVRVIDISDVDSSGASTLYFYPAQSVLHDGQLRPHPTLAWRDAQDSAHGQEIEIRASGRYMLSSSCPCQMACIDCSPGEWCDPGTASCVPDICAVGHCLPSETCDHHTGRCLSDCNKTGCQTGWICEPNTGRCLVDRCQNAVCSDGESCDIESGICSFPQCSQDCPDGFEPNLSQRPAWIVVEVEKDNLPEHGLLCEGSQHVDSCERDQECYGNYACMIREHLTVDTTEKTCIDFFVSNVRLAETEASQSTISDGDNTVQVFLGSYPDGVTDRNMVYRSAYVTVNFLHGKITPNQSMFIFSDSDFFSMKEKDDQK